MDSKETRHKMLLCGLARFWQWLGTHLRRRSSCFHGDARKDLPLENVYRLKMVIPPPVRPAPVTKFLKPYLLRMHFSNKYVSAQVVHTPTATVAASASSQEKLLRPSMESTRDVAAAAKIGKILGERLLQKSIPAVCVFLKREQKYHGKVKAVVDSVRDAGVKLL
ncbi:50S ribosomal protein L18, cyanelle [Apostasia shenzhenica]|uniref:50S ribosomal protein L18, cyanelle n=1 Tax=Apostasia shenzhenica TaxID=1088818 RepID=A0A2I0ALW1_9ASPA|nr:50S ribosomal protein L18, cyanelle [Apostasia shenzhenica]